MKYILIGYKINDETGEKYDFDILMISDDEIKIDKHLQKIFCYYDFLRVYKEN